MAPPAVPVGAFLLPAAPPLCPFPPGAAAVSPLGRRHRHHHHAPSTTPAAPRRRWPRRAGRGVAAGVTRLPPRAAATRGAAGRPLGGPPQPPAATTASSAASTAAAATGTAAGQSDPPRRRHRRRGVVRPPTSPDDRALVVGVVLCVALTAVIWFAGGRLAAVPIRLDRAAPFDYPWRLRGRPGGADAATAAATATAAAAGAAARRWSAWILYAVHQVGHWLLIAATRRQRRQQRQGAAATEPPPPASGARATPAGCGGGAGAVTNGEAAAVAAVAPGPLRRPSSSPPRSLGWPQRATLALHAAFCAARVAHTHLLSYDGLAADVPEVTSLAAVALLLVWVWLLEAPRRGVLAGARPPRPLAAPALRATAVATHGYYFSFATVYTLWYHPAASTVAHLSGFLYVFLLLLQAGLAGTAAHGRRAWTAALEGWVAAHALLTAATVGGGRLVPLFGWGLATSFVAVHLHGFGLRGRVRAAVAAAYAAGAAVAVAVGWGGTRGWHLVAIPALLYTTLGGLALVLSAVTVAGRAVRAARQARAAAGGPGAG